MWPKAFAQLIELLPHVSRLLPVADRFFQSKAAGEEANRRALEAMADGLRGDLGQVTAAHSGIYRQLNEHSEQLLTIAADARAAKLSAESTEAHLARVEQRLDRIAMLLLILTFAAVMAFILLAVFVLHRPR